MRVVGRTSRSRKDGEMVRMHANSRRMFQEAIETAIVAMRNTTQHFDPWLSPIPSPNLNLPSVNHTTRPRSRLAADSRLDNTVGLSQLELFPMLTLPMRL